jgi:hypothetical protein
VSATFRHHKGPVLAGCCISGTGLMATACLGRLFLLWDIGTRRIEHYIRDVPAPTLVTSLCASRDGSVLAAGTSAGHVFLWSINDRRAALLGDSEAFVGVDGPPVRTWGSSSKTGDSKKRDPPTPRGDAGDAAASASASDAAAATFITEPTGGVTFADGIAAGAEEAPVPNDDAGEWVVPPHYAVTHVALLHPRNGSLILLSASCGGHLSTHVLPDGGEWREGDLVQAYATAAVGSIGVWGEGVAHETMGGGGFSDSFFAFCFFCFLFFVFFVWGFVYCCCVLYPFNILMCLFYVVYFFSPKMPAVLPV